MAAMLLEDLLRKPSQQKTTWIQKHIKYELGTDTFSKECYTCFKYAQIFNLK